MKYLLLLLLFLPLRATEKKTPPKKVIVSYSLTEQYEEREDYYIEYVHIYTMENGKVVDVETKIYDKPYEKYMDGL